MQTRKGTAVNRVRPRRLAEAYASLSDVAVLGLLAAFVFCDILIASRFYVFTFGPQSFPLLMGAAMAIVFVFAGLLVLRGQWLVVSIFTLAISFFVFSIYLFSERTGARMNPNTLAQLYGVMSFVIWYEIARRQLFAKALGLLLAALSLYVSAYVVLSVLLYTGIIPTLSTEGIYTSLYDDLRGERLFPATGQMAFLLFFMLAAARNRTAPRLMTVSVILLVLAAIGLSQSRVFIVVVFLITLSYFFFRDHRRVGLVSFLVFLSVFVYFTYGVIDTTFDPFFFSQTDESTLYRRREYAIMAQLIGRFPILGMGLEESIESLARFVGFVLYPSDIGVIGIWFSFGLIGLVFLSLLPVMICCFQRPFRNVAGMDDARRQALALVGSAIGLYACISTNMLIGADSTIFAMIFGLTVLDLHRRPAEAGEAGQGLRRRPAGRRLAGALSGKAETAFPARPASPVSSSPPRASSLQPPSSPHHPSFPRHPRA